jgi:hypothetical protein
MYGDIKLKLEEQSEDLNRIIQEIKDSSNQKQEVLLAYCQIAMSLANNINIKTFYLKWIMDHFTGYARNKTKMSPPSLSSMMPIFVIYDDLDSKGKEE